MPGPNYLQFDTLALHAGQQPELARIQSQIADQVLRDHRVDGPEQVGEEIAAREGHPHRGDHPDRQRIGGICVVPEGIGAF